MDLSIPDLLSEVVVKTPTVLQFLTIELIDLENQKSL